MRHSIEYRGESNMGKDFYQEFVNDLGEFREKTTKFYNGEISVPDYKGFSGGFGSYAQRGAKAGMIRLRLAGGQVSKEKFAFLADCVEKYTIDKVHITTCESIQVHNLSGETIQEMVEECWKNDIITRGGGGDFPRNVMMSPLSGVEKEEYFDVSPYVDKAAEFLLGFVKTVKMPRKLKVCFSNGPKNAPHATFRDLGFVARSDGKFDVYSAGGLGNNPKMGVLMDEAVDPGQILYYIKAMIETFVAHGNYENRGRARTRYMQETLGVDGYKEAYHEKLAKIKAEEKLDIEVETKTITKKADGEIFDPRAIAQKQEGLYAVEYHPIGGNIPPEKIRKISDAMKDMEEVSIRLTPSEGLYFINCTAKEAEVLIALTDDSAKTAFETSVACVGAAICQVGVGDSQNMLQILVDAVAPYHFADRVLPKIHISGCPSSCSGQQIAPIGLRGAVKQSAEGPKPAFAVFAGGCELQGEERFGEQIGVITVEDMPKFFIELGETITKSGETYDTWSKSHQDEFHAIIEKYSK